MKQIILIGALLITSLNIYCQNVKFTVKVQNIPNNKGLIGIGLYNSKKTFPKKGKAFKGVYIKANKDGASYTFEVPKGVYAAACFHDLNSDKKMNFNFLGIPVEDYGFSNNVYGVFGAPYFSNVSVNVYQDRTITVYVK